MGSNKALIFTDRNFDPSCWIDTEELNPKPHSNIRVERSFGSHLTHTISGPPQTEQIFISQLSKEAVYIPSQRGAIQSIECFFDLLPSYVSLGVNITCSLLLKQDGYYFESPIATTSPKLKWQAFALSPLTSNDFSRVGKVEILGPMNPDFSSSGSAIQFGYLFRVTLDAQQKEVRFGLSNWKVVVLVPSDSNKDLLRALKKERQENERLGTLLKQRQVEDEIQALRREYEQKLDLLQSFLSLNASSSSSASSSSTSSSVPSSSFGRLNNGSVFLYSPPLPTVAAPPAVVVPPIIIADRNSGIDSQLITSATAPTSPSSSMGGAAPSPYLPLIHKAQQLRSLELSERTLKKRMEEEHALLLRQLEEERRNIVAAQQHWTSQYDSLHHALNSEKEALTSSLAEYRRRIALLEEQLRQETDARLQAQTEANDLRLHQQPLLARHQELEQEIAALRARLHRKKERLHSLLADAEASRLRLEADLVAKQKEAETLSVQLIELEKVKQEMESAVALELEAWTLEEQRWAAQKQHLLALSSTALQEKEQLTQKLAELSSTHDLETKRLNEEVDALRADRGRLEDQIAALRLEIEAAARTEAQLRDDLHAAHQEEATLRNQLQQEQDRVLRLNKDLDAAKEAYALEKSLREKIAHELFAEIDARKEGERRQAFAISALNEQMKSQTAAIVELDEALKQEVLLRTRLEQELQLERAARAKAEDALKKLDEIFRADHTEDAEWEMVEETATASSPSVNHRHRHPQQSLTLSSTSTPEETTEPTTSV